MFAHLPLIMNKDGTKLSKRQDDIRLDHFRSRDFYPESIISLLCLVGGGFSSSVDIQQNLHTLPELAKSVRDLSCDCGDFITVLNQVRFR